MARSAAAYGNSSFTARSADLPSQTSHPTPYAHQARHTQHPGKTGQEAPGCKSYRAIPDAQTRNRHIGETGRAPWRPDNPPARLDVLSRTEYSVGPRATSVRRSRRLRIHVVANAEREDAKLPRPCSEWWRSARDSVFAGAGLTSVRNTDTPSDCSAGSWANASVRAPAMSFPALRVEVRSTFRHRVARPRTQVPSLG